MLNDEEARKQALTHVLWIGGAPDAGKTSVAMALAEKYGLQFTTWTNTQKNTGSTM